MTVILENVYSYKIVQDRELLKQLEHKIRVNTPNSQTNQRVADSDDFALRCCQHLSRVSIVHFSS
jgi:carbamoylphosphate synthase large subunit